MRYLLIACGLLTLTLSSCNLPDKDRENSEKRAFYSADIHTEREHAVDSSSSVRDQTSANSILVEHPVNTIKRVFSSYTELQESTDLQENKDSLVTAFQQLEQELQPTDTATLQLLLNVWMYYDPTDFPTRKYVEQILQVHLPASIAAVEQRIRHKKPWEQDNLAPYSELMNLRAALLATTVTPAKAAPTPQMQFAPSAGSRNRERNETC